MRILFDTSVLVAALVGSHPRHPQAFPWMKRARAGEFDLVVASHTLAELYAVLSTLPVRPRISPETAWQMVHENLEGTAEIVALSAPDYLRTLRDLADRGLSGGIVYDALIARAAQKGKADQLLTLNPAHFQRLALGAEEAQVTTL